jgi:hypothetical protein
MYILFRVISFQGIQRSIFFAEIKHVIISSVSYGLVYGSKPHNEWGSYIDLETLPG